MHARGFTLIELLVVIAIIGMLSSVILASLNSARSKARDAQRLEELDQLRTALSFYYDSNGSYPTAGCGSTYGACWTGLLSSTYISSVPLDPTNSNTQYGLYYAGGYKPTGPCTYTHTSNYNDYMLATRLENPSANSSACQTQFSGWNNSNLNYLIGE